MTRIEIVRAAEGADGYVLFSAQALPANRRGLADALADGPYRSAALVPPSPPTLRREVDALVAAPGAGEAPFLWAVRIRDARGWRFEVLPAAVGRVELGVGTVAVADTAVDRLGNESTQVGAGD